jgi:hypothetical protein
MIELDIYFYYLLGGSVSSVANIQANWPIGVVVNLLLPLRGYLATFEAGTDRAKAFPQTTVTATQLMAVIDQVIMPMPIEYGSQLDFGSPIPFQQSGNPRIDKYQAEQIRILCAHLQSTFQQEVHHSYILKVEDQRILSAYTLVEKIESAVAPNTWKYLSELTRREIEESGKCLSVERHTACGFHMLRGIESVIREYLGALPGVTLAPHQRNWGEYIRLLRDNGAAHEVISIVDGLRQDDRNTLMHPEKFLTVDQAVGLFCLSLTALDRLIADMIQRKIAKEFRRETLGGPVTTPSP